MMDLITLGLKLAFEKPGCPLCRLRQETEYRYLYHLLYESVTDGTTRQLLVRSKGFCPRHTWLCQATELEQWGDGLGTGTIYEDQASRILSMLLDFLTRACSTRMHLSRLIGWLSHVSALRHAPHRFEDRMQAIARRGSDVPRHGYLHSHSWFACTRLQSAPRVKSLIDRNLPISHG